jgi:hypothetical protein
MNWSVSQGSLSAGDRVSLASTAAVRRVFPRRRVRPIPRPVSRNAHRQRRQDVVVLDANRI